MKELLLFIVQNLVTNPDAVSVDEQSDGGNVDLSLTVDPVDMGLVIGKNGGTIRAIRKLLTVRAIAENVRINLQLIDPNPPTSQEEPAEKASDPEKPEAKK